MLKTDLVTLFNQTNPFFRGCLPEPQGLLRSLYLKIAV